MAFSFRNYCAKFTFLSLSLTIRFILVYVASIIDEKTPNVKYTDTDYEVFSDAATHVFNGESPYGRHTYRYSPLAAYICVINNIIHPLAGKMLFCVLDLVMGILLWSLIESQNANTRNTIFYVAFWIYNPVTITISTRGSNDNIITLMVYASVYYVLKKQYTRAGLLYGLSVHFKIFPIIYCVPLYFFIDCDRQAIMKQKKLMQRMLFQKIFTHNRMMFAAVSAATFFALNILFYVIYGQQYLDEAWIYHLTRKDNRHNYSVYFYLIQQTYDAKSSQIISLVTFLPQWLVVLTAGLLFHHDLFLAIVVQTWAFVAFNKVMTAQYFLWYMSLIPYIAINNKVVQVNWIKGIVIYVAQLLFMAIWGFYAFQLEFLGKQTFYEIQYVNYSFFVINIASIVLLLTNHQMTITFEMEGEFTVKNMIKMIDNRKQIREVARKSEEEVKKLKEQQLKEQKEKADKERAEMDKSK